jgi:hypothetical protein
MYWQTLFAVVRFSTFEAVISSNSIYHLPLVEENSQKGGKPWLTTAAKGENPAIPSPTANKLNDDTLLSARP